MWCDWVEVGVDGDCKQLGAGGAEAESRDRGECGRELRETCEETEELLECTLNLERRLSFDGGKEAKKIENVDSDSDIIAHVQNGEKLAEIRTAFLKTLTGPPITFKLILNCKHGKTVEEKILEVQGDLVPLSVFKLKLCIEHQFSIPACCQTITFECSTLLDQHLLSSYHIRDGDCLGVSFETKGDVSDILTTIDHMKKTYVFIKSLHDDVMNSNLCTSSFDQIDETVCSEDIENLPELYFSYTLDRAETNRIFFVHCGGVRLCHKLHTQLLKFCWSILPTKMQFLELSILRCYWNITAAFSVRRSVLHDPGVLQSITQSFLRIKLVPGAQAAMSIHAGRKYGWECDGNAKYVVFKAMGALCK